MNETDQIRNYVNRKLNKSIYFYFFNKSIYFLKIKIYRFLSLVRATIIIYAKGLQENVYIIYLHISTSRMERQ